MTTREVAAAYIRARGTDRGDGTFTLIVTLSDINPPTFCIEEEDTGSIESDCFDPRLNEGRPGEDACEVMFTTSTTTPDGLYFELDLAPEDRG